VTLHETWRNSPESRTTTFQEFCRARDRSSNALRVADHEKTADELDKKATEADMEAARCLRTKDESQALAHAERAQDLRGKADELRAAAKALRGEDR
jgi:hypothetical protein